MIALSIAFVAAEILRTSLRSTSVPSLAKQVPVPWLISFVCGLLHGLGFAGALSEIGLPQNRVPLALLSFNLGVEFGQLLFLVASLSLLQMAKFLPVALPSRIPRVTSYAIGIVAMFWVCQRVVAF